MSEEKPFFETLDEIYDAVAEAKVTDIEATDFGPCCACGREGEGIQAQNIIMLEQKAPTPGTGWACFQCGLPSDGAVSVVCDDCLNIGRPIRFAIDGHAKDKKRVPIEWLKGEHKHYTSKHLEESCVAVGAGSRTR
jgi:hypothetical protein